MFTKKSLGLVSYIKCPKMANGELQLPPVQPVISPQQPDNANNQLHPQNSFWYPKHNP